MGFQLIKTDIYNNEIIVIKNVKIMVAKYNDGHK